MPSLLDCLCHVSNNFPLCLQFVTKTTTMHWANRDLREGRNFEYSFISSFRKFYFRIIQKAFIEKVFSVSYNFIIVVSERKQYLLLTLFSLVIFSCLKYFLKNATIYPVDTGRKLKVNKTTLYVQFTSCVCGAP